MQTCKQCLCTIFQTSVNFFILPAISFVKARKRLVQEKYIEFRLCKLFRFFQVCKTEGIIGTERKISAVNNNNMKVD